VILWIVREIDIELFSDARGIIADLLLLISHPFCCFTVALDASWTDFCLLVDRIFLMRFLLFGWIAAAAC